MAASSLIQIAAAMMNISGSSQQHRAEHEVNRSFDPELLSTVSGFDQFIARLQMP